MKITIKASRHISEKAKKDIVDAVRMEVDKYNYNRVAVDFE